MKFTAATGQITVRAEVFERGPGWVHISVTDTGCGISPEGTQKIFDRLYQEERTLDTNRKGLGLGLHICKELVARHGGRIWVDSKIGVGSTFHFTLPVYSLTTLLVPLIEARDHVGPFIKLISIELQLDKLPPTSEPAKAAWRAAWNSLNQLSGGGRNGSVVLPRMATNEEQGLLFIITTDDVSIEEIKSAASNGVADCAAVRHSTCRIAASATPSEFINDGSINLEQRAHEAAMKILKSITQIQAEKSKAMTPRLDFLGEVSRKVRTPATVVMGYASILRDRLLGELTLEQERVVTKVLTEINDLMLMVSNIFEAERIGSSTGQPANHEVNVGGFLQELRSIYNFSPNEGVPIVWDCPADLPVIVSDGNKLRLILQNVIHDALKFTTRGQVTITARYSKQTQVLKFAVATTGINFPPESVQAVFQHFDQESCSAGESPGGKNWGAYLVDTCTKLLGGMVMVECDSEEASILTVTLPVKQAVVPSGIEARLGSGPSTTLDL
jgi:signal transduction histidine kinase